MIKQISLEYVQSLNFKPEPHTVVFSDEGQWYGYFSGDDCVAVLCVRDKKNCKYVSQCYTHPHFRGKHIMYHLVEYVTILYSNYTITAHCLEASRNIFLRNGFTQGSIRPFKYGTQYFMRKEKRHG